MHFKSVGVAGVLRDDYLSPDVEDMHATVKRLYDPSANMTFSKNGSFRFIAGSLIMPTT
ncbi:hypothetical protein [Mesorhizobium sp. B3-2-1]|uniref:hypothetical protein n=1 Tax=Mesorhizobium sp. B3-2-1 TaxID=2589891 RepID=UPI0015E42866|nr:hypothetical protein [Mesorhizobium sp. B3-2-1]